MSEFDILIVEDEHVIVNVAKKILNIAGFEVDEAFDAETALEKFQQNKYKLIISDLMLPHISGIELTKEVKRIDPAIPVIIITGYTKLENAVKSFKEGAFDFIPKPFDLEELSGVVFRAINHLKMKNNSNDKKNQSQVLTNMQTRAKNSKDYHFLGEHSWAKFDPDNAMTIGVGSTFSGKMGKIQKIELPFINSEIWQGNMCVRIIAQKGQTHMVWAPLSGKVIGINQIIETNMNLINTDPFNQGWLFKIIPTNLESELENLSNF
jgi:FixJ family two-component response regulator/glycine cleavage system H lipoate-binding protein